MKKAAKLIPLILSWIINYIITPFPEVINYFSFNIRFVFVVSGFLISGILFAFPYLSKKIKTYLFRFKTVKIGISIRSEINASIVRYCNSKISILGLSSKISFQEVKVKNWKTANGKLLKSNTLDVIIWLPEKQQNKKVAMVFQYKDSIDNRMKKIIDLEMFSSVSKEQAFNLSQENFLVEIDFEKANIVNFALYIVALSIGFFRGIDEGIFVFEKLFEEIKIQNLSLKTAVARDLNLFYLIRGGDFMVKKKYSDALSLYRKASLIKPNDVKVLAGLALAEFYAGSIVAAEKISQELLQNYTNSEVAHLDAAFFRIRNKKYNSALKHYFLYQKLNPDSLITLSAIEFLNEIVKKGTEEIGYLFARAFLKKLVDEVPRKIYGETTYKEDFNVFVQRADQKYSLMIKYAQKYI